MVIPGLERKGANGERSEKQKGMEPGILSDVGGEGERGAQAAGATNYEWEWKRSSHTESSDSV